MKLPVTALLAAHILVGNVCLMPVASARTMDDHRNHVHMEASGMMAAADGGENMSAPPPAHTADHQSASATGCMDGHCMTVASDDTGTVNVTVPACPAGLPPTVPVALPTSDGVTRAVGYTATAPPHHSLRTTVLRC